MICAVAGMAAAVLNGGEIVVAVDGAPRMGIVVPHDAPAADLAAAEELQKYLEQITGALLPVHSETPETAFISVGRTEAWRAAALAGKDRDLGFEGYGVAVDGGNLYLWGGSRRGALFAVYAFLEEDLGCRWYTSTREVIPRRPTLAAEVADRTSLPAFPYLRDMHTYESRDWHWGLRNRANVLWWEVPDELGGNVRFSKHNWRWWYAHTYNQIVAFTRENLEAHPEWFMMEEDGSRSLRQLCPSSPEIREQAAELIVAAVRADSDDFTLICLGQGDVPVVCRCPLCLEAIEREGTEGAPHFELVNHVAAALRANGLGTERLLFLVYQKTWEPPKHYRVDATAFFCTLWPHIPELELLDGAQLRRFRAWREQSNGMMVWDYYVKFENLFEYKPTWYSMQRNLQFYRENGVSGVLLQGPLTGRGTMGAEFLGWAFAKLLWNPYWDMETLIADFAAGMYGAAAGEMRELYGMLYRESIEAARSRRIAVADTALFLDRAEALFAAGRAKLRDDPEALRRLEFAEIPFLAMRLEQWHPTEAAAPRYRELFDAFKARTEAEGVAIYRESWEPNIEEYLLKLAPESN